MNIEKFKQQHVAILDAIARLRDAAAGGIADNAESISAQIVRMSGAVKLHLSIEDAVPYPGIARSTDLKLACLGDRYQSEMDGIAADYFAFAASWNLPARVRADPEDFRRDANRVLRTLFDRMKREDTEFYPAVEASRISA